VLQCVASCCSVLWYYQTLRRSAILTLRCERGVLVCCSVLHRVAVCCSVLRYHQTLRRSTMLTLRCEKGLLVCLQCVASCCSLLQCVAVPPNIAAQRDVDNAVYAKEAVSLF